MDLVKFLKANKVKFELRHHPARFTAQEVAAAEHITGEDVAKVVVVRVDDAFAMCVLPATFVLDMKKAKKVVGGKKVALATEEEMAKLFPDCEIGAMPPFGKDCNVPVYVEEHLAAQEQILIPAGTHEDSVLLAWKDYERLAAPKVASFGRHVQEGPRGCFMAFLSPPWERVRVRGSAVPKPLCGRPGSVRPIRREPVGRRPQDHEDVPPAGRQVAGQVQAIAQAVVFSDGAQPRRPGLQVARFAPEPVRKSDGLLACQGVGEGFGPSRPRQATRQGEPPPRLRTPALNAVQQVARHRRQFVQDLAHPPRQVRRDDDPLDVDGAGMLAAKVKRGTADGPAARIYPLGCLPPRARGVHATACQAHPAHDRLVVLQHLRCQQPQPLQKVAVVGVHALRPDADLEPRPEPRHRPVLRDRQPAVKGPEERPLAADGARGHADASTESLGPAAQDSRPASRPQAEKDGRGGRGL